jgi:hypothetical protein
VLFAACGWYEEQDTAWNCGPCTAANRDLLSPNVKSSILQLRSQSTLAIARRQPFTRTKFTKESLYLPSLPCPGCPVLPALSCVSYLSCLSCASCVSWLSVLPALPALSALAVLAVLAVLSTLPVLAVLPVLRIPPEAQRVEESAPEPSAATANHKRGISDVTTRSERECHGNQLPYLVRGPYQNLLHPT